MRTACAVRERECVVRGAWLQAVRGLGTARVKSAW